MAYFSILLHMYLKEELRIYNYCENTLLEIMFPSTKDWKSDLAAGIRFLTMYKI